MLFFLPTFYKKVRARALVRSNQQRVVLVLIANSVVGTLLLLGDVIKSYVFALTSLVSFLASKRTVTKLRKPSINVTSKIASDTDVIVSHAIRTRNVHTGEHKFIEVVKVS